MLPKWAWSGSREQFLHCGLRKFCHSKSSVYRWYTQLDRRRFVYDTWDNESRLGRVMVECTLSITHCVRLNLQLHTIDLVKTCRISSFCTVASQLAKFQFTRRIARSLGDSWASCYNLCHKQYLVNREPKIVYFPTWPKCSVSALPGEAVKHKYRIFSLKWCMLRHRCADICSRDYYCSLDKCSHH